MTSITDLKLRGSVIANSDNTLRFSATLFFAILDISLLYGMPNIRDPALTRWIQRERISLFLTYFRAVVHSPIQWNKENIHNWYVITNLSVAISVLSGLVHTELCNLEGICATSIAFRKLDKFLMTLARHSSSYLSKNIRLRLGKPPCIASLKSCAKAIDGWWSRGSETAPVGCLCVPHRHP